MSDNTADKTTAPASEPSKMLFGAPVATSAASSGTAFSAATVRPFGAPENTAASKETEGEGDGEDYSDPNYRPIVSNLQLVEAKELADDEEKIFTKRSKAYRFFKDSNEWKERCVGDINLIRNTKTGKIRIEMRMEKTQRVQMNHYLYPETKISLGSNSTRMLVWNASNDTSFNEDHSPANVTLAARFQDDEGAAAFKKIFEDSVKALAELEAKEESEEKTEKKADKEEKTEKNADNEEKTEKKADNEEKTEKKADNEEKTKEKTEEKE